MKNKSKIVKLLSLLIATILGAIVFAGTVVAGTTPAISSSTYKVGDDKIVVFFNVPVWGDTNLSSALVPSDFNFVDGSGGSTGFDSISAVTHTQGNDYAILTMNASAAVGDSASTISAKAGSIFTVGGAIPESIVSLTLDNTAPSISSIYVPAPFTNTTHVVLVFSEPVYTNTDVNADQINDLTSVLVTDFTYTDGTGGTASAISSISLGNDERYVFPTLNGNFYNDTFGDGDKLDQINPYNGGSTIFDAHGNAAADSASLMGSSASGLTIVNNIIESVAGSDKVLVKFTAPVFSANTCTGDMGASDFNYSGSNSISSVLGNTAGTTYAVIDLASNVAIGDIGVDQINPVAAHIYTCSAGSGSSTAKYLDDTIDPVIVGLTQATSGGKNTLAVEYSEAVQTTGFTSGGDPAVASTTSVGDTTTACTVAGFGAFATGGLTYKTLTNSVALSADQTTFTFTLAGQTGGYRTSSSATDCAGIFTPTANIRDIHDATNVIETTSTQSTITTAGSWDLANTSDMSDNTFAVAGDTATTLAYTWTAEADPGGFDTYRLFYDTVDTTPTFSEAVSVWDSADDALLGTVTTAATTITGLTTATTAYATAYLFDTYGNPGTASATVSEVVAVPSTGGNISHYPLAPTNFAATVTANNAVHLTWTDPSETDYIKIYRGIAPSVIDGGTVFASVGRSVQEYTDSSISPGDVVSYVIKATNGSGNTSPSSETVTITVTAGATGEVTAPAEEPTPEPTTPDTTTPPVDLTYDQEQQQVKDLGIVTTEFDKATNKCEAIVMLARAAGWEIDSTVTEDGFVDTPLWCKPYAAKAKELGVVNGRTATELGVDGEVNRYEIGVMLARVLGATEADMTTAAALTIYDDEIVDWAKGAVNWLHEEGVMTGYPDNTYKGANGILKIELAVALGRAFDLLVAPTVSFHANLVGANGVPAVTTDAAGSCYASLSGSTLTYTCTVEGLDVTAAHFHLGAADENGAVLHAIEFTGNEASGTWTDLTEAQITALNAEGIYVNVHTAANPDGEIRGQVIM